MKDLFIVYSPADRAFAEQLHAVFEGMGSRFWLAMREMKAGDNIRDAIARDVECKGILLLILSQTSLGADWAGRELNSDLAHELRDRGLTVILVLIDDLRSTLIPSALQEMDCVQFGVAEKFKNEFDDLLALMNREKAQRLEVLAKLRSGLPGETKRLGKLRETALTQGDQTFQKAALTGLSAIGGPSALVTITERLMIERGSVAINHAVSLLLRHGSQGGLTALAAALFWNADHTWRVLEAWYEGVGFPVEFRKFIKKGGKIRPISELDLYATFERYASSEYAAAVRFSAQYWFEGKRFPHWVPKISPTPHARDKAIVENALPGLTDLIVNKLEYRDRANPERNEALV